MAEYTEVEDSLFGGHIDVTKFGSNIGDIIVTLQYISLQDFYDNHSVSEADFDTEGLDSAEC